MKLMIKSKKDLKSYYEDKEVSSEYIKKRFENIVYFYLHKKQVFILNELVKKERITKVLEIAPGPARITAEVCINNGIAIENSEEMIKIAKQRLKEKGKKWKIVKGDAFNINLKEKFELIFTFRFIRHFEYKDRVRLYKEIKKHLKQNGFLVFEAINKRKAKTIRKLIGKKKYQIYDELYSIKELKKELKKNGFKNIKIHSTIKHFFIQWLIAKTFEIIKLKKIGLGIIQLIEKVPSKNPLEWVIICQK